MEDEEKGGGFERNVLTFLFRVKSRVIFSHGQRKSVYCVITYHHPLLLINNGSISTPADPGNFWFLLKSISKGTYESIDEPFTVPTRR